MLSSNYSVNVLLLTWIIYMFCNVLYLEVKKETSLKRKKKSILIHWDFVIKVKAKLSLRLTKYHTMKTYPLLI
jgi:hypothetical protein